MYKYFIGLMSGTSMDAIDAALVQFHGSETKLLASTSTSMPNALKTALTTLCQTSACDIKLLGETDTQLGHLFADSCFDLLKKTTTKSTDITAIGSHGQTIYHQPNHKHPFTLQIGDPNIIAARTGITTVADFRRRDLALGGQAAPLTPAFHAALFRKPKHDQWVLNLGGIANLTWLPCGKQPIIGFDTGPGNTLLDNWHYKHRQIAIDFNGRWGKTGTINHELLAQLLADPYFEKPAPKSTGREYFNLTWLNKILATLPEIAPVDVQTTLVELTAMSVAKAISQLSHSTNNYSKLWVCGGGVYNAFLMERISENCKPLTVCSTEAANIDPKFIEAMAFAWLAKQTLEKKPGNLPSVTGAANASILGAVYY